jgi:hypothetical protein
MDDVRRKEDACPSNSSRFLMHMRTYIVNTGNLRTKECQCACLAFSLLNFDRHPIPDTWKQIKILNAKQADREHRAYK